MKVPVATYRIQFNPLFGFDRCREIVSYLRDLGISDIYASPIFRATSGSMHGYDVVDMNSLNPDLGSEEDFERLIRESREAGLGWIQDIVPNHMAFDGENLMLMDVLENGRHSEYFDFFDIEWDHVYESLSDRLLAPFLGRHYSEAIDEGEIRLKYGANGFFISYYALNLPLKIESYANVLTHRLADLRAALGEDHPALIKLLGLLYSLKSLPELPEERLGRYSQIQFIKRILWELYSSDDVIRKFVDSNVASFNGEGGDGGYLDNLLSEQLFRLSFWKVASEELNYRRFFNINGLITLRVEDDRVFKSIHNLVFRLIKERIVSGLRIDHIDGLYDPTAYLKKLREKAEDLYIVVEKILDADEELPSLWAVQGTTGYDFLNILNGVFVDERNGRKFNRLYYGFTGFKTSYDAILYEKKKLIIEKEMTGDVDNLAHLLKKISSRNRYGNDMTLYGLKKAIIEILANFPVYRTYVRPGYYSDADRRYMSDAIRKARDMNPGLLYELSFIELFLLLESRDLPEGERDEWIHFVMRFQQLTGPLMAKGFEDTTLYVYNRLLSLNEVGGCPDRFGFSVTEFHEFNLRRSRRQPHSMNATATHDTKRGEDVRARINVLSEIPELWETTLKRWSKLSRKHKKTTGGMVIPDKNDEYFLYQTLVGTYPCGFAPEDDFRERLKNYIVKAVREAKVHTAWIKPDIDYEENYLAFIDAILDPSDDNQFFKDFLEFQKKICFYGVINSLSQTLLKLTCPGCPDIYQGTELWDLTMVDPDNRRPVDYEKRRSLLDDLRKRKETDMNGLVHELMGSPEDGRIKLFLMMQVLATRNRYRHLFEKGNYIPLETDGKWKANVIAFARELSPLWIVVIAPRLVTSVVDEGNYPIGEKVWQDTRVILPGDAPRKWTEIITEQDLNRESVIPVAQAMKDFPCALLVSSTDGD